MDHNSPLLKALPLGRTLTETADLAATHAPYLNRLLQRDADGLSLGHKGSLEDEFRAGIAKMLELSQAPRPLGETMASLRRIKRRAHLVIALLDLSGAWPLARVTGALTELADASVSAALATALANRGLEGDGFFIIAFGKMGAHELNYSSDIDMAAFFDPDVFAGGERGPVDSGVRLMKDVCQLLGSQTEDGYVFRTDLRLRPDPSSTPIAVSTRRADAYYQSVGQNWERMAWIKARPCAGDISAANRFCHAMEPFVWRRHLDYWALADVLAIKRMIREKVGGEGFGAAGFDTKLGVGGIREIEFFVQTQQIILGGRDDGLRQSGTLQALSALVDAGHVPPETADWLTSAYDTLRALEHRIQMLNDEQTHTLPVDDVRRMAVAELMGASDLDAFDLGVVSVRTHVNEIYLDLFAHEDPAAADDLELGNLVFAGVDDDPGTTQTLDRLGFSKPQSVTDRFRRWHYGSIPATRSRRAQELLTAITPNLLVAMSQTGEPDQAFNHFVGFFEGLSSGVQILSMLQVEPDLLSDLVSTLAIAPRLAKILAKRPELLETLVSKPLSPDIKVSPELGFEEAMDEARRLHRDQTFLIGHRLLNGHVEARTAAAAWTRLADDVVTAMARVAAKECERRFGASPGAWCVFGLGSLGAGELTAASDLDIQIIYELFEGESPERQTWFTRFTQRLVTALSAPTAEGQLYEVDLRLRPSGRAGPVAVRLAAFQKYQMDEAWTWEHMALTRMRPTVGDESLAQRTLKYGLTAIQSRANHARITEDIRDMRARLMREKPGKGVWDIKHDPGGLIDIEFHVQRRLLELAGEQSIQPGMLEAMGQIASALPEESDRMRVLKDSWVDLTSLRQVLTMAVDQADADRFSDALKDRLARALRLDTFEETEARLREAKTSVTQALT